MSSTLGELNAYEVGVTEIDGSIPGIFTLAPAVVNGAASGINAVLLIIGVLGLTDLFIIGADQSDWVVAPDPAPFCVPPGKGYMT